MPNHVASSSGACRDAQAYHPIFHLLDDLLARRRHLEHENLPAERMQMRCGHLDTPLDAVPFIVQTPFPATVQPRAEIERAAFARFGIEMPCPEERRALLESLHELGDAPIVCLEKAFMRAALHPDHCLITLGTHGKPGWTNQSRFAPDAFDDLASMSGIGGLPVDFASPFDRRSDPPEPDKERALTWWDIRRRDVGERALAMVKRPRERLMLLLAIHLSMSPSEINRLNLAQVTQKFGRDYRPRVYLKQRLVRKKALADTLLQYRKRDREAFWDPKEPMFRTARRTPSGRSMRTGAKAIGATIERYAERALKGRCPRNRQPKSLQPSRRDRPCSGLPMSRTTAPRPNNPGTARARPSGHLQLQGSVFPVREGVPLIAYRPAVVFRMSWKEKS